MRTFIASNFGLLLLIVFWDFDGDRLPGMSVEMQSRFPGIEFRRDPCA
jgi:hypothetical protein